MKKVLIQLAIGITLFLALDLVVSQLGLAGSGARDRQDAINRSYRIRHDVFHHGLAPGFTGFGQFGRYVYPVRTNSLGFLDAEPRQVPQVPAKPRLVIIGDSFGEGIGLKWDETFAGVLAKSRPDIEVLNASVASYSPIIYYRKIRWLLEQGYRFDHVLVTIDISDIQDESAYVMTGDRVTLRRPDGTAQTPQADEPTPWAPPRPTGRAAMWERTSQWFQLSSLSLELARTAYRSLRPARLDADYVLDTCRSAWTYDGANPATDARYAESKVGDPIDLSPCPRRSAAGAGSAAPAANISRSIARAQHWMSELHRVLEARGIGLSVAVYPWPAQLHHEDRDSLQVRVWDAWCAARCAQFINVFPDFFEHKSKNPKTWYSDLYFFGDVHFNQLGNRILARRLEAVPVSVRR